MQIHHSTPEVGAAIPRGPVPVPRGGQESPACLRSVTLAEGMQKQRLVLFADFKAFHKAVAIISLFLIYFLCAYLVTGSERRSHSLPGSSMAVSALQPLCPGWFGVGGCVHWSSPQGDAALAWHQ